MSDVAEPQDLPYFEQILEHLRQERGFDFTAYKQPSLIRRILRRMQAVNVRSYEEYFDYLQVHQEEIASLFDTILINVTSFFRDKEVWEVIGSTLLPDIGRVRGTTGPIRIWSAGCASGQEPYSVAMLLAEQLGLDGLRERVKIYATDADEGALAEARHATYSAAQIADVPEDLRKYFDRVAGQFVVSRDLRRVVIFGDHDLLQDAPISKIDLLLCRNTLMYFTSEAQGRILSKLSFATTPDGYLVLGRAEMLFAYGSLFAPVDVKRRVFRPVARSRQRDRLVLMSHAAGTELPADAEQLRLREIAFDTTRTAEILLDTEGVLAAVNAPGRLLFGLSSRDVGRPLQDLEVSYRPAELRTPLHQAMTEYRDIIINDVRWSAAGEMRMFQVVLSPVQDPDRQLLGARVTFVDVTNVHELERQVEVSRQEVETAYEELQSTNEELETTNEELQSTVEELETTNEELQSTNEELETVNEELQSTNEELHTTNEEMRNRSTELNGAHSFLESVFRNVRSAVIVTDREYRVQAWSSRAEDLWGLRPEEVSQADFLRLDIGLPVQDLRDWLDAILRGEEEHIERAVTATSRRGKSIVCRISMTPLRYGDRSIQGVILLMEEQPATV